MDVAIQLGKDSMEFAYLDRVLGQFEEFFTVTQSVQAGTPVSVTDSKGLRLK
jgi:hypothetical protein